MQRYNANDTTGADLISKIIIENFRSIKKLKFDLSTEFIVKELLLSYHVPEEISKTKMNILKELVNIWKVKHKVPTTAKNGSFDFSTLIGDPTAATK